VFADLPNLPKKRFNQARAIASDKSELFYIARARIGNKPIDDLTQAIALDPENVNLYIHRAKLYHEPGHDYVHWYAPSSNLTPAESHQLGNEYLENAIADYTQALQIDPTNINVYIYRGYARMGIRNFEGALSDFNQALQLTPTNPWNYYHLAYFYVSRSKSHPEDAEGEMRRKADITKAFDYLEQAAEKGWSNWEDYDPSFSEEPRYQQLRAKWR